MMYLRGVVSIMGYDYYLIDGVAANSFLPGRWAGARGQG